MIVKIPCEFGDYYDISNGLKQFHAVCWFKWSDGMTYTYYFKEDKKWAKWTASSSITERDPNYSLQYEVDDNLLEDGFIRLKGCPIKGKGRMHGLTFIHGKLFADIILTDSYYPHIQVECDKSGNYVDGGEVYVPPTWDTDKKKRSILLKEYKNIKVSCLTLN